MLAPYLGDNPPTWYKQPEQDSTRADEDSPMEEDNFAEEMQKMRSHMNKNHKRKQIPQLMQETRWTYHEMKMMTSYCTHIFPRERRGGEWCKYWT